MSYLYVPGLQALTLPCPSSPDVLAQSATSRGRLMQPRYWFNVWKKESWIRHLSGVTLPPSLVAIGVARWIASLPAFPVNHGPPPAVSAGLLTSGGCGQTSPASFTIYDLAWSTWRTPRASSPAEELSQFSGRWPSSGMMRSGKCSELTSSAQPIVEPGCSCWPTYTLKDSDCSARSSTTTGQMHPGTTQVDAIRLWATCASRDSRTPTSNGLENPEGWGHRKAEDTTEHQVRMWATMRATDAEKHGPNSRDGTGSLHPSAQAILWATCCVEEDGRTPVAALVAKMKMKRKSLTGQLQQTHLWATCRALSYDSSHQPGQDTLAVQARLWSTCLTGDAQATTPNWEDGTSTFELTNQPTQLIDFTGFPRPTSGPQTATQRTGRTFPWRCSPLFREWLMGFPPGLTASGPLAMRSFPSWRRTHSLFLRIVLSATAEKNKAGRPVVRHRKGTNA